MMRIESEYDGCWEFFWDSQGRVRVWHSWGSLGQRRGQLGNRIVTRIEHLENPRFSPGHVLRFHFRYADDPDYYSDECDEITRITRIYINGEEVIRDRI